MLKRVTMTEYRSKATKCGQNGNADDRVGFFPSGCLTIQIGVFTRGCNS